MLNQSIDKSRTLGTPAPFICPYLCEQSGSCQASTSTQAIDQQKCRSICKSEDFDDCALFLSRFLRRSQPRYGLDTWTVHDK